MAEHIDNLRVKIEKAEGRGYARWLDSIPPSHFENLTLQDANRLLAITGGKIVMPKGEWIVPAGWGGE